MSHVRPLLILFCFLPLSVLAMDLEKCSKMLNNGWFKKYEYAGINQPLTKATKKHGMSKATSVTSTEGSTASLDPGYWSNITTSETQSSSSWGDCNAFALENLRQNREKFFQLHQDEILTDIAMAHGEYLDVLADFTLCEDAALPDFAKLMQKNLSMFLKKSNDQTFGQLIDEKLRSAENLHQKCQIFI